MSDLAVDVVKADGPYDDQRPGTSGLRKRVATFQKGTYLQNFVQAILDAVEETTSGLDKSKPILLSGDGRYFNKQVIGGASMSVALLTQASVMPGLPNYSQDAGGERLQARDRRH